MMPHHMLGGRRLLPWSSQHALQSFEFVIVGQMGHPEPAAFVHCLRSSIMSGCSTLSFLSCDSCVCLRFLLSPCMLSAIYVVQCNADLQDLTKHILPSPLLSHPHRGQVFCREEGMPIVAAATDETDRSLDIQSEQKGKEKFENSLPLLPLL